MGTFQRISDGAPSRGRKKRGEATKVCLIYVVKKVCAINRVTHVWVFAIRSVLSF